MASIQDLYNALLSATQSLNAWTTSFPRTGGNVTVISCLSSNAIIPVLPANANRHTLTFHNPGTINVYVAPTTIGSSNGPFNPTAVGGGFILLYPAAWITLSGICQQGWQATSSSTTAGQPLTIMDQ